MLVTWNVNGKNVNHKELATFIRVTPDPDVYAFGLQEVVDLNALNIIAPNHAAEAWEESISRALGGLYIKVYLNLQHLIYPSSSGGDDDEGASF